MIVKKVSNILQRFSFQKVNLKRRKRKIKMKLKQMGYRQVDISKMTGRSHSLVSNVIAGRRRARVIEVAINELTGVKFFNHK